MKMVNLYEYFQENDAYFMGTTAIANIQVR